MASVQSPIHSGWSFVQIENNQEKSGAESQAVDKIPTTVQVQLLKAGKIPDHNKGMNEWELQWVGEADWRFKTTFTPTKEQLDLPNVDLVFEGLDTYCTVELNGKVILESDNMFHSHRIPVKSLLTASKPATLTLTFPSAWNRAKEVELEQLAKKLPYNLDAKTGEYGKKLALWNGDSSRLYARKGQFNWGWDWGPVVMTVGPWKPIYLHTYTSYVVTNHLLTKLEEPYTTPTLTSTFTVSPPVSGSTATVTLTSPEGKVVKKEEGVKIGSDGVTKVEWKFKEGEVELWWPVGHGKQPIYTVKVELKDKSGNLLDTHTAKTGIRSNKLIQEPLEDAPGTSFLFQINGKRIFIGGSNWVPADSYVTEISDEKYRAWLQLMVDGNQNMVRIWGGGIYEPDVFYDLCDELGLLVWQDFQFGCGQYPAHDEFCESVQIELEQNVTRLRNHPSLVIFAGNNEDYQLAEANHLDIDYTDTTSDFRKGTFPARHIYERIMPDVVGRLSDIPFHRGSPFGGPVSSDPTIGDIHQWNVWHGSQEPWHNWDILAGRFISEFGMEGYPDIRTVDYWLDGNTAERFPQSRTNCQHNKADGFERRLELYLVENFRHAFDMESYVYYTQAMQAETLAAAYRLWRRNWKGKGREYTAGALVWQINDCWPVTSWAIADYFLRPKPAYFAIARELRPFTVGMARKDVKTPATQFSAAHYKIEQTLEIWGNNSAFVSKSCKLEVVAFDLHGGEVSKTVTDVTLAPNSSTEFWKGTVPGQPIRTSIAQDAKVIVVGARLIDADGTVLARYANWPEPWKYIVFPDAELKIKVEGDKVTLSSSKPIKGIVLDVAEGDEAKWSDQAIDLMPNDPQVVVAKGLNGRQVKARHIGDGTA